MNDKRKTEIKSLTRRQILRAIQDDLGPTGGESLMKEAFEECEDKAELEACYEEMRNIIKLIKEAL